jgi:hypothetical protein
MEQFNIDKLLQDAANKEQIIAPDTTWPIIRDALHNKNKKRAIWYWIIPIIACSFVLGYLIGNNNTTIKTQPTAQQLTIATNNTGPLVVQNNNRKNNINESKTTSKKLNPSNQNILNTKNGTIVSTTDAVEEKTNNNNTQPKVINKERSNPNANKDYYKDVNEVLDATKISEHNISMESKPENITETLKDETVASILKNDTIINTKENYIDINSKINKPGYNETAVKKVATAPKIPFKKWSLNINASYGALLVNENSILNSFAKNSAMQNNVVSFTSGNTFIPTPQYSKGSTMLLQVTAQKHLFKTIGVSLGIQLQQNKFSTQIYAAPISSNGSSSQILVDNLSNYNIGRSAVVTVPFNNKPTLVQNKIIYIGAVIGLQMPLLNLPKQQKIIASAQIVPSISLGQNINWFNKSNARFYNNKNAERKINTLQNIGLQYESKLGKRHYSLGTLWQFNYASINKKANNLTNLYFNTIGLQLGIKF